MLRARHFRELVQAATFAAVMKSIFMGQNLGKRAVMQARAQEEGNEWDLHGEIKHGPPAAVHLQPDLLQLLHPHLFHCVHALSHNKRCDMNNFWVKTMPDKGIRDSQE